MSGPRLTEPGGSADAFESTLLASAKLDRMSAERKRALALALGATAATTIAAGASGGGGIAAVNSAGAAVTKTTTAVALKWIGVAIAGSTLVAGVSVGASRMTTPVTQTTATSTSNVSSSMSSRVAAPSPPVVAVEALPTEAPEVRPERSVPAAPSLGAPARPRAARLTEEVRLIEQARAALAVGDVTSARVALDDHARRFADGTLRDEAAVLRIDVLARSGDHVGAKRAARAYLEAHPASPHGPRVREHLVDDNGGQR
jgi:hypothetical protein